MTLERVGKGRRNRNIRKGRDDGKEEIEILGRVGKVRSNTDV